MLLELRVVHPLVLLGRVKVWNCLRTVIPPKVAIFLHEPAVFLLEDLIVKFPEFVDQVVFSILPITTKPTHKSRT